MAVEAAAADVPEPEPATDDAEPEPEPAAPEPDPAADAAAPPAASTDAAGQRFLDAADDFALEIVANGRTLHRHVVRMQLEGSFREQY